MSSQTATNLSTRKLRMRTVHEAAEELGFDDETVRRLFQNEPDVLCLSNERRGVRPYRSYRIPEGAFERVRSKLMDKKRKRGR